MRRMMVAVAMLGAVLMASPAAAQLLQQHMALRAAGAVPADFTATDFTGEGAVSISSNDITTPASSRSMVVGVAWPKVLGILGKVDGLLSNGRDNPLARDLRGHFTPGVDETQTEMRIGGVDYYVYASTTVVHASQLGVVGFRMMPARN